MIGIAFGLATTAWSAVRSSRLLQYALIAGAILLAILVYGGSKKRQGMAEAVARATELVVKRMERSREIHRNIQGWPLGHRARKLRELDAAR